MAPFSEFRYKAGKPDRVKKVTRFFRDEETKLLFNEVKELERKETEKEEKEERGRIYFGSIKAKVPNLEQTEQLLKRRKKIEDKAKDEQKGGRRGSGNLACAIGLYKSGQDLAKLVSFKRLTTSIKRKQSQKDLDGGSPSLLSPALSRSLSKSPGLVRELDDLDMTLNLGHLRSMSPTPVVVYEEVKESSSSGDSLQRMRTGGRLGSLEDFFMSNNNFFFEKRGLSGGARRARRKLKPGE